MWLRTYFHAWLVNSCIMAYMGCGYCQWHPRKNTPPYAGRGKTGQQSANNLYYRRKLQY